RWYGRLLPGRAAAPAPPRASGRKRRLFACACCRRVWHVLPTEACRAAVEAAERSPDPAADPDGLEAHRRHRDIQGARLPPAQAAARAAGAPAAPDVDRAARQAAADAAGAFAWHTAGAAQGASDAARWARAWNAAEAAELAGQAATLRDILSNPFRPAPAVDPAWLAWNGGTVRKLAEATYEERAFDRLPIL